MRNFLRAIWRVYSELQKFAGNLVLVVAGIGACAYATMRQYDPVHSTQENTLIFFVGITVVISSWVRRFIWSSIGLAVPWIALVAGMVYLLERDPARFEISPVLLAVAVIPPIFAAFLIEILPKPLEVEGRRTLLPSADN